MLFLVKEVMVMENNMSEGFDIAKFHEEVLMRMGIPSWMKKLECPACSAKVPVNALRSIELKLNAKNIGDLVVQFLCPECGTMSTRHYVDEVKDVVAFSDFVTGKKHPVTESIEEKELFNDPRNNLVEKAHLAKLKILKEN
jgi:endogenous inhibitor of DNA gyrase (YacG/DUF329 family)